MLIFDKKKKATHRKRAKRILEQTRSSILDHCQDLLLEIFETKEVIGEFKNILFLSDLNNQKLEKFFNNSNINKKDEEIIINEALPFENNSFDLIISNNYFNFINDLVGFLKQINNILKPETYLTATIIGENSLSNFKQNLSNFELKYFDGISSRINPMIDIKTLGMLLKRVGFKSPIVSLDEVEVEYKNFKDFINQQRAMAEQAAFLNDNGKYLGKEIFNYFQEKPFTINYDILTIIAKK